MKTRKKARMGRPPLPKGARKTVRFNVRFTPAEARALHRQATAAGKDVAEFIRDAALGRGG
jgi:uncharacterized protein (DUF1778 family)